MLTGWICPACGEANTPFSATCINGPHAPQEQSTVTKLTLENMAKSDDEVESTFPPLNTGATMITKEDVEKTIDNVIALRSRGATPQELAAKSITASDTGKRLVRNIARCKKCGDTVESKHRHDFQQCGCGAIAVDGGLNYTRRVADHFGNVEELSVWE